MSAKEKGVDLKAAALGQRDGNVIVVNSEIQDPSGMKGKTFAIPSTQSSHYILLQDELAKAGLTLAIYLADRVVIFDANPGQIKAVLTIPLGKHRDRTSEDFLAIRDQIFEIFPMKREDAIEYYI